MLQRFSLVIAVLTCLVVNRASAAVPVAVVGAKDASFAERLAAKEIRRYVYLRTGKLLPMVEGIKAAPDGGLIVVGSKGRSAIGELPALQAEQYVLKTIEQEGRPITLVVGGDAIGTLYGAYRLAEHLGVRFYMHGDVVPDTQIALEIPQLDEIGKPLFDRRGIQPFHDFPEGPDWWNADGYKAILGQLPKMRMNFFALHTYPEGGVGPEPLTWIGTAEDTNHRGTVKFSYPTRHFTTGNVTGAWGYRPMKTSDYTFGAAALYDRDDYAADYMRGTLPWTKLSPEASNELFDRMGRVLGDVFTFARQLGIKTCIGTETPLTIPAPLKQHLKASGKDPADPAVVQKLYEGMFRRIMATHPLDYYWFWTPEGWTWSGTNQEQIDATLADLRAAIAAAKEVEVPFTLATCGWVLGPAQDRALFDNVLPKTMPMSCINRQVGREPVEPGFAKVKGRPQWAIPWMEDDPAMISPQLWAGRMRRDAADALAYGCTGLMGIHWRTRILGPNVSALAHAAWDQKDFNPDFGKSPEEIEVALPEGPDGGQISRFPNNPMAETQDDPLYQVVRYNVNGYRLDVPNGTYTVTLKLCEPFYTEPGKRIFGAKVQGTTLFEKLDLFAKVGQNRALDYPAKDVEVTDGKLRIEFVRVVEFPCIAAITIEGTAAASNQFDARPYARKINCGGPAYKDYVAGWIDGGAAGRPRDLPPDDFYADWALSQFGPEAAEQIAAVFVKLDGKLPRPSDWVGGPGGIRPDGRPWQQVSKEYAFVDALAALRSKVRGAGNLERFDYWLNNFRYMRANARVNCTWARYNAAMGKVKAEKEADAQERLARQSALPLRKELVADVADVHRHLLATVTTPGAMGNVTNWQQHIMPGLLTAPGAELAKILGEELPAEAMPSKEYAGRPRLFVPVIRTGMVAGESLTLKVIVLGAKPQAAVHWRPLGSGPFAEVPLEHDGRGVYTVTLPDEATAADLEYYVEATVEDGTRLKFPPTAPTLNQTVVIVQPKRS